MCNISNFVQYWRKDQQLLLGYCCEVVLERACCLTSEQNTVVTSEHFSRTAR